MSRIGKLPIPLPAGVTVEINGQDVAVKGPKGELKLTVSKPITVSQEDGSVIVSGIDKQAVGEMAANIRKLRKPEPYKGKGVRYEGERVRRKAGKAGK